MSFAIRIHRGSTDTRPIIRSIRAHSETQAEAYRAKKRQEQEKRREAAAARETERAKALLEEQERVQIAEAAREEARAHRAKDRIFRETPLEDLQEVMSKLQGRWNRR